ncbi:MAG: type II secretion system protein, partial [Verrucomicrobiota bacterium]
MKTNKSFRPLLREGFTMVEILTTVAIIMVLMGMSLGIGLWAQKNAQIEKAKAEIALFENSLQQYEADNGEYPDGNGSDRSSVELYQALYENGILNDTRVYMDQLNPDTSDMFKRRIDDQGLILDPFKSKKTPKPYFYIRGLDENGEQKQDAFNPDF